MAVGFAEYIKTDDLRELVNNTFLQHIHFQPSEDLAFVNQTMHKNASNLTLELGSISPTEKYEIVIIKEGHKTCTNESLNGPVISVFLINGKATCPNTGRAGKNDTQSETGYIAKILYVCICKQQDFSIHLNCPEVSDENLKEIKQPLPFDITDWNGDGTIVSHKGHFSRHPEEESTTETGLQNTDDIADSTPGIVQNGWGGGLLKKFLSLFGSDA